jgi:spore germination cell wall hydrolase CwlJ-like protein
LLFHLQNHWRRHHAIHLAGAQLSLVAALCLALVLASLAARPAQAHLGEAVAPARAAVARAPAVPAAAAPAEPAAPAEDAGMIRLQDLSPEAARLWNASNPISKLPNPPARPFHLAAEGVLDEARAVDCMTAAVYYEAGFESLDGQRAVAQVVINRLRNPLFPKTVCGVVFQGAERASGCQFTFTCDGSLARKPAEEAWERSRKVAEAALHGYVMKRVGNATHYHASYVAPYWSPSLVKVATVGAHIFYRWTGGLGLPPAFAGRYAGGEMKGLQIATLDNLARGKNKLVAAVETSATPAPQTAAVAVAAPEAPSAPLVVANAAAEAQPLLKPEALDLQARPAPVRPNATRGYSPSMGF